MSKVLHHKHVLADPHEMPELASPATKAPKVIMSTNFGPLYSKEYSGPVDFVA